MFFFTLLWKSVLLSLRYEDFFPTLSQIFTQNIKKKKSQSKTPFLCILLISIEYIWCSCCFAVCLLCHHFSLLFENHQGRHTQSFPGRIIWAFVFLWKATVLSPPFPFFPHLLSCQSLPQPAGCWSLLPPWGQGMQLQPRALETVELGPNLGVKCHPQCHFSAHVGQLQRGKFGCVWYIRIYFVLSRNRTTATGGAL